MIRRSVRACLFATLWIVASGWAAASAASGTVSLSYLALEPVRRWDIDVAYRFQTYDYEETSWVYAREERGRHRVHEWMVGLQRRLGTRSVGVLRLHWHERSGTGLGWYGTGTGLVSYEQRGREGRMGPVVVGWRQETNWARSGEGEWGFDVHLADALGPALVPRVRWLSLRDPVVLGVDVALPWRFPRDLPARTERLRTRIGIDHAVNERLVVSGGFAVEGDRLSSLWGWSLQLRPDRYWTVQLEVPAQTRGFTWQTGWRFRL